MTFWFPKTYILGEVQSGKSAMCNVECVPMFMPLGVAQKYDLLHFLDLKNYTLSIQQELGGLVIYKSCKFGQIEKVLSGLLYDRLGYDRVGLEKVERSLMYKLSGVFFLHLKDNQRHFKFILELPRANQ